MMKVIRECPNTLYLGLITAFLKLIINYLNEIPALTQNISKNVPEIAMKLYVLQLSQNYYFFYWQLGQL